MNAAAHTARRARALSAGSRSLRRSAALAALALLPALAAPAGIASAADGTAHLSGEVADARGHPLAGLTVTLTASRTYFSLRRMRSAEASPRTILTTTDERGRYALDWPWDDHYNTFELAVGIAAPAARPAEGAAPASGAPVEVLTREDISQRMATGPVVASITLENGEYVEKVRRFVATLESDDERRVYGTMGHPDEVKSVRYPDHAEVSWWYFESGKVYRFEGGRLAQVVPFDPVKPF